MSIVEKIEILKISSCVMNSSKELCVADAIKFQAQGNDNLAINRLEKAAQYTWGFYRPTNW